MGMSAYKKTTDNWCGNYPGDLVLVKLTTCDPYKKVYRVGVWGTDDIGMIKDFDSYSKAHKCFVELMILEIITFAILESMKFENF